MTKRRGRLSDEELAHYEDDIAAGVGIMQSMIRLWHMITGIRDDDVRDAAGEEVQDSFRRGYSITRRNIDAMEQARERKRKK